MARGIVLSTLRALLKAELRDAQETNTVLDTEYNYALANMQRDYSLAYDWNFLKHDWDLPCSAGTRYLSIPTVDTRAQSVSINFERPVHTSRLYNNLRHVIGYGIDHEHYNLYEGTSELHDPIQRWQVVTNSNESSNPDEIEVWPVPAKEQSIRFTGQRVVQALSSDLHKADLDDLLLVYFVAANYSSQREFANASYFVKRANDHLLKLRASYPIKKEPIIFGLPINGREKVKLIATA